MKRLPHLLLLFLIFCSVILTAQTIQPVTTNSVVVKKDPTRKVPNDSIIVKKDTAERHSPRKATLRSTILPGWGQAYNKEYWKIPLVYTAIGIPVGLFVYNNTWYKRSKLAFTITINKDTASFPKINAKLQKPTDQSDQSYLQSLQFYRNQFRRDRDYSILYTLIAWGLNVADATVFAHLKEFDVSPDLSFKITPGYSPATRSPGLTLVLAVKKPTERNISAVR